MGKAGTGLCAVILENQQIPEALVLGEIQNPISIRPQELFDLLWLEVGNSVIVLLALDYHFVSANSVHQVVEAITSTPHRPLNLERRKLIGHHAYVPSV